MAAEIPERGTPPNPTGTGPKQVECLAAQSGVLSKPLLRPMKVGDGDEDAGEREMAASGINIGGDLTDLGVTSSSSIASSSSSSSP